MIILYYAVAAGVLLVQMLLLVEGFRHVRYTLSKYRPKPSDYQPRVALIAPCRGLDTSFDRNIRSFFELDYPDYELFFVVQSSDDPAYRRLDEIIRERRRRADAPRACLLVAGPAAERTQKVHNLLLATAAVPPDRQVFAFVDSDACLKPHFLTALVRPLRRNDCGAATGYRWYVPADGHPASHVLSALNAPFASLLGPHRWNSAWGGAMAIRRDVFDRVGVRQAWQHAASDDYLLTHAVRQGGLPVAFAPACFVASYERTTWRELFAFARRQFVITRICRNRLWWLALLSWGHWVAAFWGGLLITLLLHARQSPHAPYAALLPLGVYGIALLKAAARQVLIRKILSEDRRRLLPAALIDVFLQPLVNGFTLVCLLTSASGRTITWRGIRYLLPDAHHTRVLSSPHPAEPSAPSANATPHQG